MASAPWPFERTFSRPSRTRTPRLPRCRGRSRMPGCPFRSNRRYDDIARTRFYACVRDFAPATLKRWPSTSIATRSRDQPRSSIRMCVPNVRAPAFRRQGKVATERGSDLSPVFSRLAVRPSSSSTTSQFIPASRPEFVVSSLITPSSVSGCVGRRCRLELGACRTRVLACATEPSREPNPHAPACSAKFEDVTRL